MSAELVSVAEPGQTHTVLIVEDEVLVRLVLAEQLRDCGYRVLEAGNAVEAIAVLEADIGVDVLFTDVQMPGPQDGFGLVRWTRQHRPHIEVIVTSGHDRTAHPACDLREEVPYVRKPYDPARLAGEIGRLFGSR
jgi:CheY-like chemotaxis protein